MKCKFLKFIFIKQTNHSIRNINYAIPYLSLRCILFVVKLLDLITEQDTKINYLSSVVKK